MSAPLPKQITRELNFKNGTAIGTSNRWNKGQYCSILTEGGIVGCGIYDLKVAAEFDLAIAICKGTPAKPLVDPEDLFESKIVGATPKAEAMGIHTGISGREAVELMLQAQTAQATATSHAK
jgi:uncharacterized protein YunC (DUF1805 family)